MATLKKKSSRLLNSVDYSNLDDVLQLIKGKFKTEFVDPQKLKKDLLKCYISKFFVEELRNFYTDKERVSFLKKQNPNKIIKGCISDTSNICHQTLYDYSILAERQKFYLFKSKSILSNLKFYHFHKNDPRPYIVRDRNRYISFFKEQVDSSKKKSNSESSQQTVESYPKIIEEIDQEELLIERQHHNCEHRPSLDANAARLAAVREGYLRDYRFMHSGLIEAALSQLQASRPRDPEAIRLHFENSYTPGKFADVDDPDFDFFFDQDEPQDDIVDPSLNRGSSKNTRPSNFDDTIENKASKDKKLLNVPQTGEPNFNNSSVEDQSSEEEMEKPTEILKSPNKKPANQIKRKDSGGGLFGIAEWDSDEEDLPANKHFSFIDTNLDKFNVLNFIENQEHKVAHN